VRVASFVVRRVLMHDQPSHAPGDPPWPRGQVSLRNRRKYTAIDAPSDPETIDTGTIPSRYNTILQGKSLLLSGQHKIHYDMDRDMLWRWDQVLKTHPNGMRFSVFGEDGDMLAVNEYFSVGGRCFYC
jgi:hypothetical protein